MANTTNAHLTPDMITREALRILHQNCNFIGNINREYDDRFASDGAKIGDSLRIRMPNEYTVRTGRTFTPQATTETSQTLTVSTQKGVDTEFTSKDLTLDLDDFSERILTPAMTRLAAAIEGDALSMINDVPNVVAADGSAIVFRDLLLGRKKLVDNLAPTTGLKTLLNTQDNVDLVDALKGLFNSQAEVSKQYREGFMGRTAGFDFFENTLLPRYTSGTAAATTGYVTNGADQEGATIVIDTGTTQLLKGDVITIAGVNAVHPESKVDLGYLKSFVVTADSGTSATSVAISPTIVATGGGQNVSAAVGDGAALVSTLGNAGAVDQSLQFHPDAFTFVSADLVIPKGVDMASRQVMDGISMRLVRDYQIGTDEFGVRFDVLYGYKTIRPELAVKQWHN